MPSQPVTQATFGFVLLLIGIASINPFSAFVYLSALPAMTVDLQTDYPTVQLSLSLFFAAVAIAQIVVGLLSDRFGRRPVLLAGLALFAASSLACALASSIWLLIIGRVLQGVGACSGMVIGRAVVRDLFDRERAASMLGYVTMGYAVAPTFGPLIGGFLEQGFGWRSIFALLFASGVAAFVASWWRMPETRRSTSGNETVWSILRGFGLLATKPLFIGYVLMGAGTAAMFFSFIGSTPYVAAEILRMDPVEFGAFWILAGVGYVIGNFLTGRFSRRIGINRVGLAGATINLAAMASLAAFVLAGYLNAPVLFGHMLISGVAQGLIVPNAVAGGISVNPSLAGAAAGLMGSLQMGVGAITTILIGAWLPAVGTIWPLIVMMGVSTAIALAAAVYVSRWRS